MPSNITPVSTWTTPLTGPANGDPVDGGIGGPAYDMGQKLANRIERLKDLLPYATVSYLSRYVDDASDTNAAIANTSSTSYTTLTGWSPGEPIIAVPAVGDVIMVRANLNIQFTGGGNAGGYVKLAIYDGTTEFDLKGAKYYQANNDGNIGRGIALVGVYTIASAVSHTLRVKGKCLSGSDTLNWFGHAGILVESLRQVVV